jgi:hypothetical protein
MAAGSTVAAGCSTQSGEVLAKQACGYVYSSIAFYESSLGHNTKIQARHLQAEAYDQLQLGLQPAALAAGDDGQWQALMTTISESSRVPEGVLVSALRQQCAVAEAPGATTPPPGTTQESTPAT